MAGRSGGSGGMACAVVPCIASLRSGWPASLRSVARCRSLACSLRSYEVLRCAQGARCARMGRSLRSLVAALLKCGDPQGGHQMDFSGAFLAPSRKFLQFETSLLHFSACNSVAIQ